MNNRKIFSVFFILALSFCSFSQQTQYYNSPNIEYRNARELFHKEKYAAAYEVFKNVSENIDRNEALIFESCRYYVALCSYELMNNDAGYLLKDYIDEFPENALTPIAKYYLANLYYRDRKYKNAAEIYEDYDWVVLSYEQQQEYFFKYGYSAFMLENYEVAKFNLSKVKDTESFYSAPARYYFGHIAYIEKNYLTAYQHFQTLTDNELFGSIIPYYMTQILYFQQKYDELILTAVPFLKLSTTTRLAEITRLIGESYYKTSRYKEAVEYFEKSAEISKQPLKPEDYYKMGFSYYRTEKYEKSIEALQKATTGNTTLAQNAHYHIGYCYIKLNNKNFARNAFYDAYKNNIDKDITEDALFLFAKLSYELSVDPYNEAINALIQYIQKYPNSIRLDEAYEYLINLYFSTKNYKAAIESFGKIKKTHEKLNRAYQKIAYYHAIELFNDKKYLSAIELFDKSLEHPYDRDIRAEAYFWKGEAFYRMGKYNDALKQFELFQGSPGAFGTDKFGLTYYNMGYCYYNMKNYEKSLVAFRIYEQKYIDTDKAVKNDIFLRLADNYYALKRFSEASIYYDKIIKIGGDYADYALYQRANSKGVRADFKGKINDLNELIKTFPKSAYIVDALYEQGNTYLMINDNDNAIKSFKKIVDTFTSSKFHPQAMLKIGLTYYNAGDNYKALEALKNVNSTYQGTEQAKESLVVIRNIYTEMNQVEDFVSYVKEMSGITLSDTEQDTITFIAAENSYMRGDCVSARKGFDKYIKIFPDGMFLTSAYFYRAECDYQAQRFSQALEGYEFVANTSWNKFSESSVLKAAKINYSQENYKKAAEYYLMLDNKAEKNENVIIARTGVMRSQYNAKNHTKALASAQRLMQTPNINNDDIIEARAIIGRCAYSTDDLTLAQQQFNQLTKLKNENSAEALYYLALIDYKLGKYQESERIIFELINTLPSYEYWIAKSFILLADNYLATDNIYQAKHTLRSVIDNYQGADLVMEAQSKMKKIEEQEALKIKQEELEEIDDIKDKNEEDN